VISIISKKIKMDVVDRAKKLLKVTDASLTPQTSLTPEQVSA
jgi:hypothetical protein